MKKILAALGLLLLLVAPSLRSQVVPASPVGTWDFAIGGRQVGLAVIQFNEDFTFSGVQFIRPNPIVIRTPAPDVNPRNPFTSPREGASSSDTPSGDGSATNFVGGNDLVGRWGFDSAGKVIGLLDQVSATPELVVSCVTNPVTVDVGGVLVTTNEVICSTNLVLKTNAVSFRASVVPGKRLTLVSYLPAGRNVYRGLVSTNLPDLTGALYGDGRRSGVQFFEFMDATPTGMFPNEYFLEGEGAGYQLFGWALVSRHRRIAVYTETLTEFGAITVHTGPFSLTTLRGKLKGRDSKGNNYSYTLVHQ